MLPMLLLAAVINISFLFLMSSLSPFINASIQPSILASPLLLSFLDTCSVSLSWIEYYVLCIVFNFLSFSPFVWVSPLTILRMILSIIQGGLLRYISLSWDFCCRAWFWEVFFWGTLFLFFPSSMLVWCHLFQINIP